MPIIRNLVLLTIGIMLIPTPPDSGTTEAASDLATPGLIVAATQAVGDIGDFCGRQPGVCETAQYVAGRLELKAKYGAQLLYEWANEANGSVPEISEADGRDALMTGSLELAAGASTLTLEDAIPEWREPNRMPREG